MNEFLQSLRSNANKNKPYNRNRRQYDGNGQGGHYSGNGGGKGYYGNNSGNYGGSGNYEKRGGGRPNYGAQDYAQNQVPPVEEPFDIAGLADSLMKTLDHMALANEKRAEAENRKAAALEMIAVALQGISGVDPAELATLETLQPALAEVVGDSYEDAPEAPQEMACEPEIMEEPEPAAELPVEPACEPEALCVPEETAKKAEPVKKAPARGRKKKVEAKVEKKAETSRKKKDVDAGIRDKVMLIIEKMRDEGATYNMIAQRLIDEEIPTFSGKGQWHAQTIHRLCQSFK